MASNILNACYGVNVLAVGLLGGARVDAAPGRPRPVPSLEARLQGAFQRRDAVELERAARRMGLGGLRFALGAGRATRTAALAAAPLMPRSWQLLPSLVPLCGDSDRSISLAAATAVQRIAEDLRPGALQHNDEAPETLTPWARELRRLAADRKLSLEVRVKCIQALAQLLESTSLPVDSLLPLLADPEPGVRRSATELFARGGPAATSRLAKLVATDETPSVARAAGTVLCAEVPLDSGSRSTAFGALQDAGALPRLRELCLDREAGVDEVLDLARCLIHSSTAADRGTLRGLRARSPSVRRQLEQLVD